MRPSIRMRPVRRIRQSAIGRLPRQADLLRDRRPRAVEFDPGRVATRFETKPGQQSLVCRAYVSDFQPGTQVAHLARHYTRELQHLGGVAPHVALADHGNPRWGLGDGVAVIGVDGLRRKGCEAAWSFGRRLTGVLLI